MIVIFIIDQLIATTVISRNIYINYAGIYKIFHCKVNGAMKIRISIISRI